MGLFQWFSTKQELDQLRKEFSALSTDFVALRRQFTQIEQDWDATVDRVSKTLRRIRRTEQAADAAETPAFPEQTSLPLTTVGASPDRRARILEQLARRKVGE